MESNHHHVQPDQVDASGPLVTECARSPRNRVAPLPPGWQRSAPHQQGASLPSFTYTTCDLFDPERLYHVLRGTLPGVLQAHGYFWIAAQPDWAIEFTLVGSRLRFSPFGRLWAEAAWAARLKGPAQQAGTPSTGEPTRAGAYQELVFIGADIDPSVLTTALEACLLRQQVISPQLASNA